MLAGPFLCNEPNTDTTMKQNHDPHTGCQAPCLGSTDSLSQHAPDPSWPEALVPRYTSRLVREGVLPIEERIQLHAPGDAAKVLIDYFAERDREEFVMLLLDTANTVVGFSVVSVGGLAASIVEPRQVFKVAVLANAAALVLSHNHPSGNTEPSREDLRITKQLVEAGRMMGISIHDHLIIGEKRFTSLAERGLL